MTKNIMTKLALYIDIEGFGRKYENGGKKSFIDLTNDLYSLGRNLLCHHSIFQFGGDGFLIKENLIYQNIISQFIDLSAALLQMITIRGGAGRVQISYGYMADISGLYSDEIQKELQANHQNILGGSKFNVMFINQVIGTSIINCYKLKGPKGPLLLIDKDLEEKMKNEKVPYETIHSCKFKVLSVNWLKHRNENTELILKHLNLNSDNIEKALQTYIENNALKQEWKRNALKLME